MTKSALLLALACLTVSATSTTGATPLMAFATSSGGTGDLHSWPEVAGTSLVGLAAADRVCAVHAQAAGLPNPASFVAWLSDSNDDAYCRMFGLHGKKANKCGQAVLPTGAGPWVRTDGMPFAAAIEFATANNAIYSSLDIDESGQFASGESFTATSKAGEYDTSFGASDCGGWQSDAVAPYAFVGDALISAEGWTNSAIAASCADERRLI